MESCINCPSYVAAEDTAAVFGRNLGVPACKRFGSLLGRPGLDDHDTSTLHQYMAMTCGGFGLPAPANAPEQPAMKIFEPDERVVTEAAMAPTDTLINCRNCKNCVGQVAVKRETGFPFEACLAKGKIIIQARKECQGCPFAQKGKPQETLGGINFLEHYETGFKLPTDQVISRIQGTGATTDPSDYPTDRELTDSDRENGVRSWRRLTDPEHTGNEAWLPVFEPGIFSDEELAMVPQMGDHTHPETYVDYAGLTYAFAAEAYELQETLVLQGDPGLGKTEFARHVAYLMQVPFRRFSFTSASEVDDMIGKMMYDPEKGTYFHRGRLVDAYSRPGVMVLDELNLAEPALREALRPLFDNNKQLVLDAGMGEMVSRDPFCFLVIAQNPSWDIRNTGAREGDDADYNRLAVIDVPYPPEVVERHIIVERCKLDGYKIPDETVDLIVKIAGDIRISAEQGLVPFTWGIRQQIKVARKTQFYGLLTAYRRAALDFYEPETREVVMKIVRDYTA